MPLSATASHPDAGTPAPHRRTLRYPLQVEIAVVFTLLIAILGLSLVWYNYSENKKATLAAAADVFERISRHTAANIQRLYSPAEALVALTAKLDISESDSLAQRLALLGYFTESLRLAEHISNIFVAYPDGEFFMVTPVRDERAALSMNLPMGTAFVVNSIEHSNDGRTLQSAHYFDTELSPLGFSEPSVTEFDPRTRPWYRQATGASTQIRSGFYIFAATGETGTTIAQATPNREAVVGADLTLRELAEGLATQRITPSSKVLVFNSEGMVLTTPDVPAFDGNADAAAGERDPVHVTDLNDPVVESLSRRYQAGPSEGGLEVTEGGRNWMGSISSLPVRAGGEIHLALLVPRDELLANIIKVRTRNLLISGLMFLVAVLTGWAVSRRIATSLRTLAGEAQSIRELKLDTPITVRSHILEVDELASTMSIMKTAVQEFVSISKALSAERDFGRLLENLLSQARGNCNADAGSIFLFDEDQQALNFALICNARTGEQQGGTRSKPFEHQTLSGDELAPDLVETHSVTAGHTLAIDDINRDQRFDFSRVHQRYDRNGYTCTSLLHLPLRNRKDEIIGVLELVNARNTVSGEITGFSPEVISYVEALSSQAAITLDNRRLLKAQKDLLDSFIQLIAGAIDAKSPYTSGHCQRVPELARMLAEAAQESPDEPFREFGLSDEEWYELHIASWLHDCGKVTTPEYVVDKATKLECIYNRIHEIRMRFELLWRDAQIDYYKALGQDGQDAQALKQQLDQRFEQLQADYQFIAECNVGGEFMAQDRVERLERISAQTWVRHFSDRLGLSEDELARKQREPEPVLPTTERLIADKAEHIVPRNDDGNPFGDNPYRFRMDVPEHAFNYGELYNLSIARGTLTDEDRFKINEHIVQTIILLNKLPFPRELRRVPAWAGNHHEKLDGTGYPRRLGADQLSIPERIMAIADIFEALTASDRPYKKAKTLSESIRIMSFMRNDGHVCPQLFDLFLTSGVYRDYGEQFLSPEQVDEVDVSQYLQGSTA